MKITSIKYNEDFDGTLEEAIVRATEINDEYQPAFGVSIEDANGYTLWTSDE